MADTILGSTSSVTTLSVNTSAASAIDFFGDTDWWRVTLQFGYGYQIWVEGSQYSNGSLVDPYVAIYNSSGVFQLVNDNYDFFSTDSYTYAIPSANGTFFISAEESGHNAVGTYLVTLWQDELATTSTAASVSMNSNVSGRIGYQSDTADWYAVTLVAGTSYQFDLVGSQADGSLAGLTIANPYLVLRGASGQFLSSDDDSGLDQNARIFYTPSISGTYYLDVEAATVDGYGMYRLFANASPVGGALTASIAQTASIDYVGDSDLYSISLVGGTAYGFAIDGVTLSDPYMELLDSNGNTLFADDDSGADSNSFLSFTPSVSGTYYVLARESGNNAAGSYSVLFWQLPTLSIGNATTTEGNGGTTNLTFTISLSAASPVPVSVTASTSGTTTASALADFASTSTIITIPAGQLSGTFAVQIVGDTKFEATESLRAILSAPVSALIADGDAYGFIVDNDNPYALPSDPSVGLQWYLYPNSGIDVFPVWNDYTGSGIRVAVFDQGIDASNPDLNGQVLTTLGRVASNLSSGGSPISSTDNHGTAVAGTIAAARDGGGIVGVAYGASLVSIYNAFTLAEIPNAFNYASNFDVLNNSWGFAPQGTSYYALYGNWAFADNFLTPTYSAAGSALANLASTGRGGLGTVVVQSAGNSFALGDDTNLHNFQNSQYVITVAATDYTGNSTSYSSPGSSVLISAPGGAAADPSGILTTDRAGALGYSAGNYTFIDGTSFSSPIVAGVVALMLEANPNLGYRDVQEILAYSARQVGQSTNTWEYNGALNWNGGGLHFDALSHDLGFGLVDARAAVRLAETWQGTAHTAANRQQVTISHNLGISIPDNTLNGAFDTISVNQAIEVERVEVTLNVTHPYIGDLSVLITSPGGTTSFLLWRPQQNSLSAYGTNQDDIHSTFDSVLSWGENSVGAWGLGIYDNAGGDVGTFDSWTLNLIGKPASQDDVYIYTDEYSESVASIGQSARSVLSDSGGSDTLNAAACSTSVLVNLSPGSVSTIDGRSLTISTSSLIENAIGGDGNDFLLGNTLSNVLSGMRGSDQISGFSGNDLLTGGGGNDTLDGGIGLDKAVYTGAKAQYTVTKTAGGYTVTDGTANRDGIDTLSGIERLQFSDALVTLGGARPTDVNGDGKSDLTMINAGNGTVSLVQLNGVAATAVQNYGFGAGWTVAETKGDINGDGKTDLAVYNAATGTVQVLQLDGVAATAAQNYVFGTGWALAEGKADVNGDGKNDLLMTNSTTGTVSLVQLNGVAAVAVQNYVFGAGWTVAEGKGDFNGDGKTDFAVYHAATGTVQLLQLNGVAATAAQNYVFGAGWQAMEVRADFNGDGKNDLMMFNAASGTVSLVQLNGVAATAVQNYVYGAGWTVIEGKADFNGDGKTDLAMYQAATGTVQLVQLDGVGATAVQNYVFGAGWTAASVRADVNGDGKNDLAMFNAGSGTLQLIQLDGVAATAVQNYVYGAGWTVSDVSSDYNGDGKTDFAMFNGNNGTVQLVQLNGVAATAVQNYVFGSTWSGVAGEQGGTLLGGNGNDPLVGTGSNDVLNGLAGNDSLSGGVGNDSFVFSTALNAGTNVDTVTDFVVGVDKILVDDAIFTSVAAGSLAAGSFVTAAGVPAPADANDYFLYNANTGALSYDADGNGGGAAVQFAALTGNTGNPLISAADFAVI